ncbi:MAG: hypothetical protein RSE48_03765 [Bacilli bacterium]
MKKTFINFNILAIILISILAISIPQKTFQNDTYYYIKIGESITRNNIDMKDHYSWVGNLDYSYPHWLFDVITYKIHSNFGFEGLYIFNILCALIIGLSVYFIGSHLTKNKLFSLIVALTIIVGLESFLAVRSQNISYILFIFEFLFIEKFLEKKDYRYIVGLLAISTLLVNVHVAVWPAYFILFMPSIAEYIIYKFKDKINIKKIGLDPYKFNIERCENAKYFIILIFLSLLTGFLTPIGLTPFTYIFKTMKGNSTGSIVEHLPIVLANSNFIFVAMMLFFGLLIFSKAKIKVRDFFLIAGLFYMTLMSKRHSALLISIGSIAFIRYISAFIKENDPCGSDNLIKLATKPFTALIIISITALACYPSFNQRLNEEYHNEFFAPISATKYIKTHYDINNIKLYNNYADGAYLLFNDILVFQDSRCDLYTKEFNKGINVFFDGEDIYTDYKKIFKKYDFDVILENKASTFIKELKYNKKYKKVYEDRLRVIYEKV